MSIESSIRKLARSSYWQRLYRNSKELNGIKLFYNETDLSGLQIIFIYWLEAYHMLYEELMQKEWENLDTEVIENDIRCDAFLYYRSKELEKRISNSQREIKKSRNKKSKGTGTDYPVWTGNKS
jgi:hypothetical protein